MRLFVGIASSLPFLAVTVGAQASGGALQQPILPLQHVPANTIIDDIPLIGFGTWNLDRSNASDCVQEAIKDGYRHIDAAKIYGNQIEVGRGIAQGLDENHLERNALWVTSKLWNTRHVDNLPAHEAALEVESALDETLQELGLPYLDLYLMHFPISMRSGKPKLEYVNTWKAMAKLPLTGKTRHVGISNFSPDQLEEIIAATPGVLPYAHQLESHPYLPQTKWIAYNQHLGIRVTAYSPLGNANPTYSNRGAVPPLLENDVVLNIAKKRHCTPAQVAIKWGLARGTNVIPKSAHAARIAENWEARGCSLKDEDVEQLAKELPTKRFNNPGKSMGLPLFKGLEDAESLVADASKAFFFYNEQGISWMGLAMKRLVEPFAGLL